MKATIFVIEQHIEVMTAGSTLYVDGTFSILPLNYKQMFIIFAETLGWPRPLAYVLMTHKTMFLFKQVFRFLRDAYNIHPSKKK